jgi:predicted nucleic acid-binding protein
LDSNILLYVYSTTEPAKRAVSTALLEQYECCTSIQALNEFCNVCLKKYHFSRAKVERALQQITAAADLFSVSLHTLRWALVLHERYQYSYYDCVMLASALQHSCDYFYSEDLSAGQMIEGTLEIINPFS